MRFGRALSNYSHRGLTKVRDEHNLDPFFDLVQPGKCFPCAYDYDERSEAQLTVLERYGILELLPAGEIPAKADIAPQYFDPLVLATLPDEFEAAFAEDEKPVGTTRSEFKQLNRDNFETVETEE